jgi:hypothetical protein
MSNMRWSALLPVIYLILNQVNRCRFWLLAVDLKLTNVQDTFQQTNNTTQTKIDSQIDSHSCRGGEGQ